MTNRFFNSGFSYVLEEEEPGVRNFNGYRQHREEDAKGKKYWGIFHVTGFDDTASGENGFCHVMKSDGTEEKISIDKHNRILICGRRYGRNHWNH